MSTATVIRRSRLTVRAGAAVVLIAGALAGATTARGYESGTRPIPGEFKGRIAGTGFGHIQFDVVPISRTSPVVAVQWLGGFVPGVCVKEGKTRVAGRDGAIGIGFDLWNRLRRRPRTEIPPDGTFVFKLVHSADVLNGTSYSVSIRGTFGRKTVSGRVQGIGTDPLSGKCRVNRTFTARLSRG